MKKPRKPKASPAIPWTETDLSGEQFLALCARAKCGELRLTQCGVGSSNGAWNVQYLLSPPVGVNRPAFGAPKPHTADTAVCQYRLPNQEALCNWSAKTDQTGRAVQSSRLVLPVDFSGAKPWR